MEQKSFVEIQIFLLLKTEMAGVVIPGGLHLGATKASRFFISQERGWKNGNDK